MTQSLEERIRNSLKDVQYPGLDRDIISFGFVRDIEVEDGSVRVIFEPSTSESEHVETMEEEIVEAVNGLEAVESVTIRTRNAKGCSQGDGSTATQGQSTGSETSSRSTGGENQAPTESDDQIEPQKLPGVDHVIAVASGKGGVGKSTVAVNLAETLSRRGWDVGLADLDVYGPSAPTMFGVRGRPTTDENGMILPIESHGIQIMSIGFLLEDREPTVWRGPIVMQAVEEFLHEVTWGDLDVLITDLPPGTGDVQLSLLQTVDLDGTVVVTTPQPLALLDVDRSVEMCRDMDVPLLGIVENMSRFVCDECGTEHQIFGDGGGQGMAQRLDVPFLGELPLLPEIREGGDQGRPIVHSDPNRDVVDQFDQMAQSVEEQLSLTSLKSTAET